MNVTIFFIVILGICIGLNIVSVIEDVKAHRRGGIIMDILAILLCCLVLWLNISDLKRELKYPTIRTTQQPRQDTVITKGPGRQDTTYIWDFKHRQDK